MVAGMPSFTMVKVSPMIKSLARAFADGEPIVEVRRKLYEHYTTLNSRNTAMAHVRKLLREWNIEPPSSFVLSAAESNAFKMGLTRRVIEKNEDCIEVSNPRALLEAVWAKLAGVDASTSVPTIATLLLLVSGRRTGEIVNARSSFTSAEGDYFCRFEGQLKKRQVERGGGYDIPLLCRSDLFLHSLAFLRERQASERVPVAQLSSEEVTARYSMAIGIEVKRLKLPARKPHDLRAVYLALVDACFTTRLSRTRLAMRVLGHCGMHSSNSYMHVRLTGSVDPYTHAFGEVTI